MTDPEFILRVLRLHAGDDCDQIYWTEDGEDLHFFVNVNDVFWWACADGEDVTPDNIGELERAYTDCFAAAGRIGRIYAPMLFACRVRKMRPQGAAYPKDMPELWPLFDAAGPERETDSRPFGNPKPNPSIAG